MREGVEAWLRAAAVRVRAEAPALTALDQAIGDGDHGINLDRGFTAIVAMLDERPAPEDGTTDATATADLLRQAGKTLISKVGGASGPLYGTAFLRGAGAVAGLEDASPAAAFVAALEAAAGGISALGKSAEGEATMLDALFPAARAARGSLDGGGDLAAVTAAARAAAAEGATATTPMLATKGRASYLGERSIGHQDPGATSAALLLAVLADTAAAAGTADPAAAPA
jgi:phosphoenolpyruvate---glycerone phosphotransferase subunit DhaL